MRRRTIAATLVLLVGLAACSTASPPSGGNGSGTPVVLNDGDAVLWTTRQTTTGNAAYSPLEVYIEQSGGSLSGSNRDNIQEVDVVASGTVDSDGKVSLTLTLSNGGSPRQTLVLTGTVAGSGSSQTISGSYTATGPTESGTFAMNHN